MTMREFLLTPGGSSASGRSLGALWRLLRLSDDDPRAVPDPLITGTLMGLSWLVNGLIIAALLPVAPPVAAVGPAGWGAGVGVVATSLVVAALLLRARARLSRTLLAVLAYVGVALLGLIEWLAGTRGDAYVEVYLLWALTGAALLSPRRACCFFVVLATTVVALEVAVGVPDRGLVELAVRVVMWAALSTMALVVVAAFRGQRAALRREGALGHHLARVDVLTGLGNRRAFDESLAVEVARAVRAGGRLSIGVFDIRDFKGVNDRHGHVRGDDCLRAVAASLRDGARAENVPFRWGGDEFAVLLPDAGYDEAVTACRRLADRIERDCRRPDGRPLTARFGAAEREDGWTATEMVARADAVLVALKTAEAHAEPR